MTVEQIPSVVITTHNGESGESRTMRPARCRNGFASDSLRSLLSVLPRQASLGQKGELRRGRCPLQAVSNDTCHLRFATLSHLSKRLKPEKMGSPEAVVRQSLAFNIHRQFSIDSTREKCFLPWPSCGRSFDLLSLRQKTKAPSVWTTHCFLWWRWRESNSRPKAFPQDFLRAQLMFFCFASVNARQQALSSAILLVPRATRSSHGVFLYIWRQVSRLQVNESWRRAA